MHERWVKLAGPLCTADTYQRSQIVKMAAIRRKAARKLRDKHLLEWLKHRVAVLREVKRLEEIARREAEEARL